MSFNHRLLYLDYEGPVSGNRGIVRRWDGGEYRLEDERPGRLLLWFDGARIQGWAVLKGNEENWTFRREDSALTKSEPGGGRGGAREDTQKEPPDEPLPPP